MTNYEDLDGDDHDGDDHDDEDLDVDDHDGDYQPVAWAVEIGRSSRFSARGWVQLMTLEILFSEMAPSLKSGSEVLPSFKWKKHY